MTQNNSYSPQTVCILFDEGKSLEPKSKPDIMNVGLGAMLTLSTGRLVDLEGFAHTHEIIEFLVDSPVYTHMIPQVFDLTIKPWLDDWYPDLPTILEGDLSTEREIRLRLSHMIPTYGDKFRLTRGEAIPRLPEVEMNPLP